MNRRLTILTAALACLGAPATSLAAEKALDLTLTPHADAGAIDGLAIHMRLEAPAKKAGEALLRLPLVADSIPTPRYDSAAIQARDDQGPLPLTIEDEAPTLRGTFRQWKLTRATVGDVVVAYIAPPRPVSAATRPGPLYDLRAEGDGLNGAGIAFLAVPPKGATYIVNLHWDLSKLPAGSRGVWSFGEGDVKKVGDSDLLTRSYYAVGPVKRFPDPPAGRFAMYWLKPPPFDPAAVAARVQGLFKEEARFFSDPDGDYRVFVRAQPYATGGGTSLTRSFMFGYGPNKAPTLDSLQGLLAHEMVHNWMRLDAERTEAGWYSEGGADYYSVVLSYRAGLLTPDQALKSLNQKAAAYYTNPLQSLSNLEADKLTWSDNRAQVVPYGRGFVFLALMDAEIHNASHGARGIDDVVQDIRHRQMTGQPYGLDQWTKIAARDLGPRAKQALDAMANGETVPLKPGSFARCLIVQPHTYHLFDYGFDHASLEHGKKIAGLLPGSPAEAAGLRNGDEMVQVVGLNEAMADEAAPVTLKLLRDGQPLSISVVARGKPISGYAWARNPAIPDHDCKL